MRSRVRARLTAPGKGLIVAIAATLVASLAPMAAASSSSHLYASSFAANYASSLAYSVNLPLQKGSTGSDVATLQSLLKTAGFDPGPIDGIFGNLTERAVVAFQEANDLAKTGRVEQTEWDLLAGSLLIQRGDRGENVRDLQQRLAGAGFDPGPIDGIFGSLTQNAVSRFQTANGLPATGSVDQATWNALSADPGVSSVLMRRGDRGSDVRALQNALASAGFNPGPIDGIFGSLTESAVRSYQSANSFTVTGTVTQDLLDHITGNAQPTDTVLQIGDRGPEVEELQRLVWLVGFDPGPFDGIFGSGTERAVRRFQGVFGLPGDGIVGQQTLDKMHEIEPLARQAYDYGWTGKSGTEQWRGLVTSVFAEWGLDGTECGTGSNSDNCIGPQIENALKVMHCESRGMPNVVNYLSGTTGLFQHRPSFWSNRVARVRAKFPDFPSTATPYNPEHNIWVAALLVWESRETLIGNSTRSGPWDDGPEPWGHWDGSARTCVSPPLVSP